MCALSFIKERLSWSAASLLEACTTSRWRRTTKATSSIARRPGGSSTSGGSRPGCRRKRRSWKRKEKAMPEGKVEFIHIAEAAGGTVKGLDSVRAVPGRGLEGDRYFAHSGTYSDTPGTGRDLTLIEGEQ